MPIPSRPTEERQGCRDSRTSNRSSSPKRGGKLGDWCLGGRAGKRGTEKGGTGKGKSKKGKGKTPVDNPRNLCANFQVGLRTRTSCPYVHEIGTPTEQKELERLRTAIANARSRTNSPAAGQKICFAYLDTGYCLHGDKCVYSHDLGADNGKGKRKAKGKTKKGKE